MPKKIGIKPYGASAFAPQQDTTYGGAMGNGYAGSQTPASQANAATQQSGRTGHAPSSALGDLSSSWGQALYVPKPAQARYFDSIVAGENGRGPTTVQADGASPPDFFSTRGQDWRGGPAVDAAAAARAGSPPIVPPGGGGVQQRPSDTAPLHIHGFGPPDSAPPGGGGIQAQPNTPILNNGPTTPETQPIGVHVTNPSGGSDWSIQPNAGGQTQVSQPTPKTAPQAWSASSPASVDWSASLPQAPAPGTIPPLGPAGPGTMPGIVTPAPPSPVVPPQSPAPPTDPNAPPTSALWSNGLTASADRSRPSDSPGSTDPLFAKLYEYAKAPGYEYLKDQPDLLRGYYQYVDDLRTRLKEVGFDGSAADRLDFVDYLAHQGQASPQAGRAGYDTWTDMPAPLDPTQTQSGGSGGYKQTVIGDPTRGVDPAIQGLVNSYINSDPRYEWLAQSPIAVQEYQAWANQTGNNDTDLVDWLKNQPAYAGKYNPQAGRNGYDTFLYKKNENGVVVPRTGTGPLDPSIAQGGTPPAVTNTTTPETQPIGVHVTNPDATPSGITTAPKTTTDTTTVPPTDSGAGPIGKPDVVGDPTKHVDIGAPSTDSTTAVSDPNALLKNLSSVLAPGFQWEQDQLTRASRASSAANGGYADDSGGAGANLMQAQQGLAASQGSRLSDYAMTADQKALDRTLQYYMTNSQAGTARYQVDADKAIAAMNADVQRLGITTNADIEQGKLDLSKYGIDKNDLLDRYKAELALKGQQYSADKQLDAAAMQKAASTSIAAANERASKYAADLQRATDMANIGQNDTNSKRSYDLGVLGINSNIYNTDQNNLLKYLQLLFSASPTGQLGGGLPFQLPSAVLNP